MYKKLLSVAMLAATTGYSASVLAQVPIQAAGLQLARTSNCMACHQIDQKRVGPAFSVIAERFAGQEGAAEHLARSISNGSRGQWGAVPMPAQPQVNHDNSLLLANWILSLSPQQ